MRRDLTEALREKADFLARANILQRGLQIRECGGATGVGEEFCLVLSCRIDDGDLARLAEHEDILVRMEALNGIGGTYRLLELVANLREAGEAAVGSLYMRLGGPDGQISTRIRNVLIAEPEDLDRLLEDFSRKDAPAPGPA